MIATCQTRIAAYAGLGRAAGDAALEVALLATVPW